MRKLTITLVGSASDIDWLKDRIMPMVEETIIEEEGRLDGLVKVDYDWNDMR
jgi:hypothetical protein